MTNHTSTNDGARGFTPGELVDITITGARYAAEHGNVTVFDIDPPNQRGDLVDFYRFWLPLGLPGLEVSRRAPAEWPPQPGDVWRDRNGDTWAALGDLNGAVEMRPMIAGPGSWHDPYEVLGDVGPMRLEYRPGWTPAPEPDEYARTADGEVDERAERIAALRDLADMLERNPGLTMPRQITVGTDGPEALRAWGYALGVEVTPQPYGDTMQWWADKTIRSLPIHTYWIDHSPSLAPTQDDEPDTVEREETVEEAAAAMAAEVELDAARMRADLMDVDEYERATAADVVAAATDDRGDADRLADTVDENGFRTGGIVPNSVSWTEVNRNVPGPRDGQ